MSGRRTNTRRQQQQNFSSLSPFIRTSFLAAVTTATVLLLSSPPSASADRLGIKCHKNGVFYCHDTDPSYFTRCIEYELYEFRCPEGLHFNTVSQTCDWPSNADCSDGGGKYKGTKSRRSRGKGGSSSSSSSKGRSNQVMHDGGSDSWDKKDSASASASGSSADLSASKGGKPWWRPDDVDPSNWENLNNLVEIPFDGSISQSASVSGKKKAGSSGKSVWKKEVSSSAAEGGKKKSSKVVSSSASEKRPATSWHDGPCTASECKLPHCRCPGTDIPGGLSPKNTPMMVMLTFDDEVSAAYYGYFQRLFRPGRYNPNGCPVRGCLFVSGSGTDYDLVYPMYAMGMEIASHTITHKFPHTWWATASYQEYIDEVEGQRKNLVANAGVPHEAIKGFRVPFLQVGGDNMFQALHDLKFTYDTSMFTGSIWEGSDPAWPFTLDYSIPREFCQHKPCPVKQYPGLWEIPVQRWYGVDGISCAMPDGCTASADADEDLEFLRTNFRRYYESNRAPLGIFVHARWFHTEHHLDALDRFIDELMDIEDVYIVTPSQVIEWMRSPTSMDQIKSFKPWSCEGAVSGR